MKRVFFKLRTGYCGMDGAECIEFPDDVTEEELDDMAWELACENASTFGIYPESEEDEVDEDYECKYDGHNIEGSWEIYNPKKHDGMKPGGGNWFED